MFWLLVVTDRSTKQGMVYSVPMSMHKISLRRAHSGLGELCTYPIHKPGSDLYDKYSILRTETASHSCVRKYTWYCAMLSMGLTRETYYMLTVQTTVREQWSKP